VWEPLIEEVRPHGKTLPKGLRRTISATIWRHHGAAGRATFGAGLTGHSGYAQPDRARRTGASSGC